MKTGRLFFGALVFTTTALAATPPNPWRPASRAELSPEAVALERDAAAELLLWRVEVDDSDYPGERKTTEYLRYKIFVPGKADKFLQIARTDRIINGQTMRKNALKARLTQPDGSIREMGDDSILERKLSSQRLEGGWKDLGTMLDYKEKYLAVGGIEPGAILEVQITTTEAYPTSVVRHILQMDSVAVRKLEYSYLAGAANLYENRFVALNMEQAELKSDPKKQSYAITATNLPGLQGEPFAGVPPDYALTAVSCYTPYRMGATMASGSGSKQIDDKAGPWAVYASYYGWIEQDRSRPTSRVKKAAAELIKDAGSELEKAQRVHRRVQRSYQEFKHRAKSRESQTSYREINPSLDAALEVGEVPHKDLRDDDFIYLALSLYRAAGLSAELILLPNREFVRLDRRAVSRAMLQELGAVVNIGGVWHFSLPNAKAPFAFGELPWQCQGQDGLLARPNRQEFIPVPFDEPARNAITNLGVFMLAADGALKGEFLRVLTGQPAAELRAKLLDEDSEQQNTVLKQIYAEDLKGADLSVTKIEELENPDQPLKITYKLEWPGYAVLTANRLILRGSVFRARSEAPFPSATRHNRVIFPYRWREVDRVALVVPPDFAPESMVAPKSYPGGVLGYNVGYSFEAAKRLVHMQREFLSAAVIVPLADYPNLKKWHDAVTDSDHHELVFLRTAPAVTTGTQ